jgi:hypothetical protein
LRKETNDGEDLTLFITQTISFVQATVTQGEIRNKTCWNLHNPGASMVPDIPELINISKGLQEKATSVKKTKPVCLRSLLLHDSRHP